VPNNDELILNNTNYSPAANQKIITNENELSFISEIVNFNPEATYTATLNNEPAGMTATIVDGIVLKFAQVQWTPTAGQADEIYNNIELEITDGTNTSSYVFSVRVY
jgi:hypothetical protein